MADHDGRGYSARHTTVLTIPRFGLLGALSIERRAKAFVDRGRGRSRSGYVRTVTAARQKARVVQHERLFRLADQTGRRGGGLGHGSRVIRQALERNTTPATLCDDALVARRGIQNALDARHEAGDELHAGENVQVVSFQLFEFGRRVVQV